MLSDDIARFCDDIDAYYDHLLPILADALEEAGDPRAAGLRRIAHQDGPRPAVSGDHYGRYLWWLSGDRELSGIDSSGEVSGEVFCRLPRVNGDTDARRHYPSRSAAYLALAEAMSHD